MKRLIIEKLNVGQDGRATKLVNSTAVGAIITRESRIGDGYSSG